MYNCSNGLRTHPFLLNFPYTFGDIGTSGSGRFGHPFSLSLGPDPYKGDSHEIGSIFCAVMMALNRWADENLVLQLLVDALKLVQLNPTFLDKRDALLKTLDFIITNNRWLLYTKSLMVRHGLKP